MVCVAATGHEGMDAEWAERLKTKFGHALNTLPPPNAPMPGHRGEPVRPRDAYP